VKPLKLKHQRPEDKVQESIIKMLRYKSWYVKKIHGNMYQSGLPDLLCCHRTYGLRFVEVKLPNMKGSKFTEAQLYEFPLLQANGCAIWVLTGDAESEYAKLFKPGNWWQYLEVAK